MFRLTPSIRLLAAGLVALLAISWYFQSTTTHTFFTMNKKEASPYQAPFGDDEHADPKDIVPGSYSIKLAPGYSIQDVSDATGINIETYVISVFPPNSGVRFHVMGVDDSVLTAIRGYRGVKFVGRDYYLNLDKFIEHERRSRKKGRWW